MVRAQAWGPIGHRVRVAAPRNRGRVETVIGSLGVAGIEAATTFEGGTTTARFLEFVTTHLAPTLKPGDVVVMDNLAAHHSKVVISSIESCGARVLFTPTYSPDLNAIEFAWSKFKAVLRKWSAASHAVLRRLIPHAAAAITPKDSRGYFGAVIGNQAV